VLVALLITLAGGFSYVLTIDSPWARETGAPAIAIMVVGCGFALWLAMRRRTKGAIATGAVNVLLTGFLVVNIYLLRLPAAGAAPSVGAAAPDFTLVNHESRSVTRSTAYGGGPVLLVFYRGHW
jgi:hypothetical protein